MILQVAANRTLDTFLAILIGTAVTAAGVIILKTAGRKQADDIEPAASRQATTTG